MLISNQSLKGLKIHTSSDLQCQPRTRLLSNQSQNEQLENKIQEQGYNVII